jgi:hypothetical protein
MDGMTQFEPLLDANEVMKMFKCSLPYVYKLADAGRLPCVRWECPGEGKEKPRTMVRFKLCDVIAFIEAHYNGAK